MPKIVLENITKRWKKFYAVENLNLVIEDNAFVTLLGPSGCGKTTTLRMIAGLETPTEGRITIGDKVVFDSAAGINIPANKRKVGFLFQNYALWPNMTVYDNIAFGLKNINEPKEIYDFDAKNYARLAEILKNPKDVADVINDCRDKNGAVDKKKAYIKLIDAYSISMMTAKTLLGYNLQSDTSKADALIKELETKHANAVAAHKAKGEELDKDYRVLKNGQPIVTKRKLTKEEVDLAVRRVSRIVKIGMFMDRYPAELSGGQQQRVAIARTLAPEPSVLFMDEPLSNLDAKLRVQMRTEIRRIQQEVGITAIYVTHDQSEAMAISDKIIIMDKGVVAQMGTPQEIYYHPVNEFVADFIGEANFLRGPMVGREGKYAVLEVEGNRTCVEYSDKMKEGETYTMVLRPEAATLADEGSLPCRVVLSCFMGSYQNYHVMVGDTQVKVTDFNPKNKKIYEVGDEAFVKFDPESVHVL